jgi:hypothetical protein
MLGKEHESSRLNGGMVISKKIMVRSRGNVQTSIQRSDILDAYKRDRAKLSRPGYNELSKNGRSDTGKGCTEIPHSYGFRDMGWTVKRRYRGALAAVQFAKSRPHSRETESGLFRALLAFHVNRVCRGASTVTTWCESNGCCSEAPLHFILDNFFVK